MICCQQTIVDRLKFMSATWYVLINSILSCGYKHNSISYWDIMRIKQCGAISPILHRYWKNIEIGKHVSFSISKTKPLLFLKSKVQLFLVQRSQLNFDCEACALQWTLQTRFLKTINCLSGEAKYMWKQIMT